jgi:hypothetical protein
MILKYVPKKWEEKSVKLSKKLKKIKKLLRLLLLELLLDLKQTIIMDL